MGVIAATLNVDWKNIGFHFHGLHFGNKFCHDNFNIDGDTERITDGLTPDKM